jgi:hypothetical protein
MIGAVYLTVDQLHYGARSDVRVGAITGTLAIRINLCAADSLSASSP